MCLHAREAGAGCFISVGLRERDPGHPDAPPGCYEEGGEQRMPSFDFIADYQTAAGADMHRAYKAGPAQTALQAAAGISEKLTQEGCHVVCISHVPGDRPLKELEEIALTGPGAVEWRPVYVDRAALLEIAAGLGRT